MTAEGWGVSLEGVVESVCTTEQPDGRWNVAALGLHAKCQGPGDEPIRARTWGHTRTLRNLERTGSGYVHFGTDPMTFVNAALDRWTVEDPILDEASMWVEIEATRLESGHTGGTEWVDWEVVPVEHDIHRRAVPLLRRAEAAVVEMTVAVSRLDVPSYDAEELVGRMEYYADVIDRCGNARERAARDRILELWDRDLGWGDDHDE